MGKRSQYKNFVIKSDPQPVLGRWKARIAIVWATNGVLTIRRFLADTMYDTEQEADTHGICYGERIVDGRVAGMTVD